MPLGRKARAQIAADHLLGAARATLKAEPWPADHGRTPLIAARLALLRHGHTAWNRAGRIQGRIDEPLDAQARDHLAGLRLPDGFEQGSAGFQSAFPRRRDGADRRQTHAAYRPRTDRDGLGRAGKASHGSDLLADPNSGYRHIEEWGWDFQPPGGETPKIVWERIKPWIASLEGSAVVVSHIGIMRVVLARATGWNFDGPPLFRVKRDRLYRIDVRDDGTLAFDNEPVRLIETGSR